MNSLLGGMVNGLKQIQSKSPYKLVLNRGLIDAVQMQCRLVWSESESNAAADDKPNAQTILRCTHRKLC